MRRALKRGVDFWVPTEMLTQHQALRRRPISLQKRSAGVRWLAPSGAVTAGRAPAKKLSAARYHPFLAPEDEEKRVLFVEIQAKVI